MDHFAAIRADFIRVLVHATIVSQGPRMGEQSGNKATDNLSKFDGDLNPIRICDELELLSGKRLRDGKTLLFLDEIQLCPRALASLRYFREQTPGIPVIAAGSLLDFALDGIQFPVGRVQFANLHPMSFSEYLEATGNAMLAALTQEPPRKLPEAVHVKLLAVRRTPRPAAPLPANILCRVAEQPIARLAVPDIRNHLAQRRR